MTHIAGGSPPARRIAQAISMGHYQRSLVLPLQSFVAAQFIESGAQGQRRGDKLWKKSGAHNDARGPVGGDPWT
jgi:hypothetical protein